MRLSSISSVLAGAGLLALAGCPNREVSEVNPTQDKVEPKEIPLTINRDIDILFVIDNSGSMAEEQNAAERRKAIAAVKVQLVYCRITAPVSGRVGLRLVDPGNFVQTTDTTGIVVLTQLQPITVVFTIPEDNIPSVLDKLNTGAHVPVEAYDRAQQRLLATGALLTLDNEVDQTTGTVKLKAMFPNTDHHLFPNQFVNARLQLDVKRGATVVPAVAIQRSPRGPIVYVVKPDQTVEARPVTVGVTDGDDVAIDKGLSVGEQVVVDGADRLRDGSHVALQTRSSP